MLKIIKLSNFVLFVIIVLLQGCGGGSGEKETPVQQPVVPVQPPHASVPMPSVPAPVVPTPPPTAPPYAPPSLGDNKTNSILVFSKTAGFRHGSITDGKNLLASLAEKHSWDINFTEDSSEFRANNLSQYSVVVWLNTTGDVLNAEQQSYFETYIESGGGYLGIHAASDTEYSWPWYGELVGAYFDSHPNVQEATINVEDQRHLSTHFLSEKWIHTDEWYNFNDNPRTKVNVLLSLDEESYSPGAGAMEDHPIAWYREIGQGRSFYTGLGHTSEAYVNQEFVSHIEGGLVWAGNLTRQVVEWTGPAPTAANFTTEVLASAINQPMELDISVNGDIYIIGREGQFYAMENNALVEKSTIAVNASFEGGLIGFALDPNFIDNRYAYFHYTDVNDALHHISRITIDENNQLNLATESILLSIPIQIDECCHVAGSMDFDNAGNLYIATGDNTNPFSSAGYTPIDEGAGRSAWDAQKSASNTDDLRGKILRIKPAENGYEIPDGNLFQQDDKHRGEIYTMGHRNPFRITIDSKNDQLIWAEIGPDAGGSDPNRGPGGYDELNKTDTAGNFGWPYFSGNNEAYNDYDFVLSQSGAKFDPENVINDSPNNTGALTIPNAQPAWVTLSHRALMVAGVYRWDANIVDEHKLPSYFDGRLLYWNFNNDEMFEASIDDATPDLREWLDTSVMSGIIDGAISPHNNRLYLISFGGNCCGKPNDAGLLVEVKYTAQATGDTPTKSEYAINAGGSEYENSTGKSYQADAFFSTGTASYDGAEVGGTDDSEIYQSHRWTSGSFSYNLPIINGEYKVSLQFAETYFTEAQSRVFHVDAEGERVISGLDVFAMAGGRNAYQATFDVNVSDSLLNLDFVPNIENPMISGIVIAPVSSITYGSYITFVSAANGQYVTMQDGVLIASSEFATEYETFLIVDAGSGEIALQSLVNGNYISVLLDETLSASATSIGEREKFTLVKESDGTYSIRASINGKFISAENGGEGSLVANRDNVNDWEKFRIAIAEVCDPNTSFAISCRLNSKAYLNMPITPADDYSNLPQLLSQTGVFQDTANLTVNGGLIAYEPISPLWSDRAEKLRWVSVPSGEKVVWTEEGKWKWPTGTVFVKHFALPIDEGNSVILRRLETRLIVMQDDGQIYGATYKWREDNSDAELLTEGLAETIAITSITGNWKQTWNYPSPKDCLSCHNPESSGVLGLKTASLNSEFTYPSGIRDNQLLTLNRIGIFTPSLNQSAIPDYPSHARISDQAKTPEHRLRSYWDINCGSCHGPQGIAALWDARYETPLSEQGIINGLLANQRDYFADYGLVNPKVVDPGNINNSILYIRDKSNDPRDRMPPIGRNLEDTEYLELLVEWINSLE